MKRGLPWTGFLGSGICHFIAFALLIAVTRFLAWQPHRVAPPIFDHSQIVYYSPSEYLPPLDTRTEDPGQPAKADPEFSRQPIISVPPEADNRSQTIVAPTDIVLQHDVALPNIVSWSDKVEKPRLEIPEAPLSPAAEITRLAPTMVDPVVTPPPDASRLAYRREQPNLQTSVVAPPPELSRSRATTFEAPQPAVVAPPPNVESAVRRVGDLNIGHSSVIAPAPLLPLAEQRAVPSGRPSAVFGTPQVVAPPPSLSGSGGGSSGSPGRMIALSLHPGVGAPPDSGIGNRRGSFAATPEGHAGATGTPGASAGTGAGGSGGGKGVGGPGGKAANGLPGGLYVGSAPAGARTSPVAGDPGGAKAAGRTVNPNLIASIAPPRVSSRPARAMQPDTAASLSEAERAVFGARKFYSIRLNMPNLNSAGGSWIVRFAELKHDSKQAESNSASDLSQPNATRKVDPGYPLELMRENVAGTVIVYGVIRADGTVGNVRILQSVDDRLDRFASRAVAQWQFEPATKNGAPVDVEATFVIPFRPRPESF